MLSMGDIGELWEYVSHTYPIAIQYSLDLSYAWELHGISTQYYSID